MTPEAGKLSTESVVVHSSPGINTLAVFNMAIWVGAAEQSAAKTQIPPDRPHLICTQLCEDKYSSSFSGKRQVPIQQRQPANEELH